MMENNTAATVQVVAEGGCAEKEIEIVDMEKGLPSKAHDEVPSADSITAHEVSSSEGRCSEQDAAVDDPPAPKPGCCGDQLKKMKTTADWWSLWIGLASFSLCEFYYRKKNDKQQHANSNMLD